MRGYGELPEWVVPELNGLLEEVKGNLAKMGCYLAGGAGQDLGGRLEKLETTGSNVGTVRDLERIIDAHGLVEFRAPLSNIVDRLESSRFEIAVFGRVSTGKSSLLNHLIDIDVLPVGVNPITAVPTRIRFGPEPALIVCTAGAKAERMEVSRLAEFVTEQLNPANQRQVTRVTLELPSPKLRNGVVLVDTPGLGSLASAGTLETRAYLPQCDLGVVLIDGGSTLTDDDIGTVQSLYAAGIPPMLLLSKADLLAPGDLAQSIDYVKNQLSERLGVKLPVKPVSVAQACHQMLEDWFQDDLVPVFEQHVQLAQKSLQRKVGALRESVASALATMLVSPASSNGSAGNLVESTEVDLRKATGRIENARTSSQRKIDGFRALGDDALKEAVEQAIRVWTEADHPKVLTESWLIPVLTHFAATEAQTLASILESLSAELTQALEAAADSLHAPKAPKLNSLVQEMPMLDLGGVSLELKPGILGVTWKSLARPKLERQLREKVGPAVAGAFSSYARLLDSWARATLSAIQQRFEEYADGYRAQLARVRTSGGASGKKAESIRRDLEALRVAQSDLELAL
jgi:GTP-binding protein EngB required for normal cell division